VTKSDQGERSFGGSRVTGPSVHRVAPWLSQKVLGGVTALFLVAGFADLIRGGITASAFLLVIAWVVLVPAFILRSDARR
jgi:hypothetical protein